MVKKLRCAPRIHADFYYGLVLMIVGVGLLLHTLNNRYDFDLLSGDVSTVSFPRVLLNLCAGFLLILMVKGHFGIGSAED